MLGRFVMKKTIFLMIFCTLGITSNSAAMCPRIRWFAARFFGRCCYCLSDEYRLYSAIKTGNMSAVEALLSKESEKVAKLLPNFPRELCEIIGEYCSDIDATLIDKHGGVTLLYTAAVQGDGGMVRLLIDRGYGLGCKDGEGLTPLHAAILMGNDGAAKVLIEAGAVVDALDVRGCTSLALAVLMYSCFGAADGNGLEHWATEEGFDRSRIVRDHLRCVHHLLAAGANPNCVIIWEFIPEVPALHLAVACGNADVVRLLLEFKADPMVQVDGRTAIDFAKTEEMRNLLRNGARRQLIV
jgi:hypothetical protein